jgi:ketosteroid isomerase-like protein
MSEENVETFKRLVEGAAGLDAEAILADLDPDVEWHPAFPQLLGGERAIYREQEGIRLLMSELREAFAESDMEFPDIRDLGDRVLGLGRVCSVGKKSGVETESPFAFLVDFKNGRAMCVRSYLDHEQALEAAGLSE